MIKWTEEETILIIVEGYCILMYLFCFIFTVLYITLSSLLRQRHVYIDFTDFYLGVCNVKSY